MGAIPGKCHCGRVRFEVTPPTDFCSHCHCQDCRLTHGAAFVTWASVSRKQFRLVTGESDLKRYESDPGIAWIFCQNCGSSLFYESDDAPGQVYFTVSSLSAELDRVPEAHVSYEERLSWSEAAPGLPKFRGKTEERMDPSAGGSRYAVIFRSRRAGPDDGYEKMAEAMEKLAREQPGFLGVESARDASGAGITVSYWDSLEAIGKWKENERHRVAQSQGKAKWYASYRVEIARVEKEYSEK